VCQGLAALMLIVMLAEPVLNVEITKPLRRTLLVLLDTSGSMAITDKRREEAELVEAARVLQKIKRDEVPSKAALDALKAPLSEISRLDLAKAALTHPDMDLAGRLGDKYQVRYFCFDDKVNPASGEGEAAQWLAARRADGRGTRLGSAIEEVAGRHAGQPVAGVLVLSDFAGITGPDPVDVARKMKERNIPVYTVGIGLTDPPDIAVRRLIAPEVVFAGDKVPLRVQVDSSGFKGKPVDLVLAVDGESIITRRIILSGGTQFEELEFLPAMKTGMAALGVSIKAEADETTAENNAVGGKLRIIDEKIKILYVEGSPRWEYRYLRWVLLRDTRLKVTFLMTEGDPELAEMSPTYIRSFPETDEAILKYDLVIIGDVPSSFFNSRQVACMQDLVKRGGGSLLMIAGSAHAPSSYVNSPVAEMLPVKPMEGQPQDAGEAVCPIVTPEGQASAVTQLDSPELLNTHIWGSVKPLGPLPLLTGPRPGAEVLLSLPRKAVADKSIYPLVAWQRYGNGKTMYVGTDDLWRLRKEEGDKYHARFWGQAIQFLTLSRLLGDNKQVTLETGRKTYAVGEQINLFANVLTEKFEPVVQPSYTVLLAKHGDESIPVEMELAPVPNSPGLYTGSALASDRGAYVVRALPKYQSLANTVEFNVEKIELEQRETGMRADVAEQIAQRSGGKRYSLTGLTALPKEFENQPPLSTVVHKEKDLWDLPLMLVLLVVFTGIEWYLRRRDNLV